MYAPEDLDVLLSDMGVACTANGVAFTGLLDLPAEVVGLGQSEVVSIAYVLTVKTSDADAATIKSGTTVTVAGSAYTVRERLPVDDGALTHLTLRK